jgi:hypothetical protein
MSFLLSLKSVSNTINSIAREMDNKVDTFADNVLAIVEDFDCDFFTREKDDELAEKSRVDMKQAIKNLFTMFEPEDKKKKNINGYILFTKERREECSKNNPTLSPNDVTKVLSQEWKALDQTERDDFNVRAKSVAPQTEEEKKAKRSSSKKPAKEQIHCDFSGCTKVVKNPTQHEDGCTYCSEHFKKVVAEAKKAATPKCQHVGKEGKACTSDAINGEWCTRHMKKSSPKSSPVAAPVAEEKKAKANKKAESKKEEKPVKESVKAKSPVSAPVSPVVKGFNFKTEKPVDYSSNPEYWKCSGIKLDGETKNRLHKVTGLVLDLSEAKLIGRFIDGKATLLDDLSDDIKTWAKKSGINVGEDDGEDDMDIELDEELESEDEE